MQYPLDSIANSVITKKILRRIGVSAPPRLIRAEEPWQEGLLKGKDILIAGGSHFLGLMQETLAQTGAAYILTPQIDKAIFSELDHYTIPALDNQEPLANVRGIIYDSSHLKTPEDLKELFHFFHATVQFLVPNCRIVILAQNPQNCIETKHRATVRAITGFSRSLAKELARNGTTLQLLQVGNGKEAGKRAGPAVEFFLSDYSSFITGQIVRIGDTARGDLTCQLAGSLAGKVALVTGAAGGIGAASVKTLSDEGAHVIALDRPESEKDLINIAKRCDADPLLVTLGTPKTNEEVISCIRDRVGKLDIIVHNAGITRDKTLKRMSEVHWNLVMSINLISIISLNEALLGDKLISEFGRIICLSSISGIAGNFGQTNYSSSKSGLLGYVEGLAQDLRTQGITVNAIAPGFIETQMTAKMPFVAKTFARRLASLAQGGLPSDVAKAITFLASSTSAGINGSVLRVCGGHLMGA